MRDRIGELDATVEQSKRIFEVELTEDEADALENFLKHITSSDFRVRAKTANEAYMMASAAQEVRKAIVNKKSARR